MTDKQLQSLVETPETISNGLLKEAVADLKKKNDEEKKAKLIHFLEHTVEANVSRAVKALRQIRAQERKTKQTLVVADAARAEFLATGDPLKYIETLCPNNNFARAEIAHRFGLIVD